MKKYFIVLIVLSLFLVTSVSYAMRGGNGNNQGGLLPLELEPVISNPIFCKDYTKIHLEWGLSNTYGEIMHDSGISWGELSNGVWTKKTNGIQNYLEFNLTENELLSVATGTPVSFSANAHWHGWTIPISGNVIVQDVPRCQNL